MIRKIVHIEKEKCNGCGACANACHEGAIAMVDGKAELIKDDYCDGLGDCLPACPMDAIHIIEREASAYDEEAVKQRMEAKEQMGSQAAGHPRAAAGHVCPGSMARSLNRVAPAGSQNTQSPAGCQNAQSPASCQSMQAPAGSQATDAQMTNQMSGPQAVGMNRMSRLQQWPVQIKLVPTKAPYFENANLLIAADCTAYAYADFHETFIRNHITLIGCPKLDEGDYAEKLTEIIKNNNIKSIKIVRMEVPCCGGIQNAVVRAMQNSGKMIPWQVVTISCEGTILE